MDWKSSRIDALLEQALVEDQAMSDSTTNLVIDPNLRAAASIVAPTIATRTRSLAPKTVRRACQASKPSAAEAAANALAPVLRNPLLLSSISAFSIFLVHSAGS